ncbi:hypothetical protein FE257_004415 [Aspergillus nanangensis]|uniref:Uncharacterized protein n=1 Tax=Aspergillus nanangensis TaxID=2582783 RepID=A0AAD4GYD3_ASPNN|nr:hypothetical protein FE257_004415 [Aspergillus nanangensis]
MKLTFALPTALLALGVAAFDKNQPWGKRDYACVNAFQGIPDNSTVAPGTQINVKFNRADTGRCDAYLNQYPGDPYSLWLYNNPVRNLDVISFDQSIKITDGIAEADGCVTFTIPDNLPVVADDSVWYLRLSTSLSTAPQMPTLFNAAGPFAIRG